MQSQDSKCVICLETFHPPIRSLPCGHSFCETCLENHLRSNTFHGRLKCPICQIIIPVRVVTEYGRNYELENVIQVLQKINLNDGDRPTTHNKPENPTTPHVLSGNAIQQLKDKAKKHMANNEYEDAKKILETIVACRDGKDKILSLFHMATCQIECNQVEEAAVSSTRATTLIESLLETNELNSIKYDCDVAIQSLVELFIKVKNAESIIALAYCRFNLVKKFFHTEWKLFKLKDIGYSMEQAAIVTTEENKETLAVHFDLMDEVLSEMNGVNVANVQFKCKKVVFFLKHFGFFCNEAKEFEKAAELAKQAKSMMETVFSQDCKKYRLYGYCFTLLSEVYSNLNLESKAKYNDKRAFEILMEAKEEGDDPVPSYCTIL